MTDQQTAYEKAHRKLKRQVRNKHEEVKRLRRLLAVVYDSIDNYAEPDPNDPTRQWNCEFNAYHRGCVLFSGGMKPEEWKDFIEVVIAEVLQNTRCDCCDNLCHLDNMYRHSDTEWYCQMCHEVECAERNLEDAQ
jgi:hypothetical protein